MQKAVRSLDSPSMRPELPNVGNVFFGQLLISVTVVIVVIVTVIIVIVGVSIIISTIALFPI